MFTSKPVFSGRLTEVRRSHSVLRYICDSFSRCGEYEVTCKENFPFRVIETNVLVSLSD